MKKQDLMIFACSLCRLQKISGFNYLTIDFLQNDGKRYAALNVNERYSRLQKNTDYWIQLLVFVISSFEFLFVFNQPFPYLRMQYNQHCADLVCCSTEFISFHRSSHYYNFNFYSDKACDVNTTNEQWTLYSIPSNFNMPYDPAAALYMQRCIHFLADFIPISS